MDTLTDLRWKWDPTPGDGPLMANCLWHPDDTASMAIYPDHVYCFGCAAYKWPDEFLREQAGRPLAFTRSTRHRSTKVRQIPDAMVGTYHAWLMDPFKFGPRRDWLHARGLRDDILKANLIGHCGNAFTIPIRNGTDGFAAIRYRRDDALYHTIGVSKYWGTAGANAPMLYEPLGIGAVGQVVLCEGELDALRLAQEGYRAMSLTNGCAAFREEHVELLPPGPIIICYDQDREGSKAGYRVTGLLGERARLVQWPEALGKDATELLQRYPLSSFQRYVRVACD